MVPWVNFAHPKQWGREKDPFSGKQSITPGQPGGGAKTAPLEIVITLNQTVLPDKKKLLHTRGDIYPDTESRIYRKENRVTLEGGEALVKQGN